VLVEGGEEFPVEEGEDENGEDAPGDEPNFNRADGVPVRGQYGWTRAWRARRIARTGWRGRDRRPGVGVVAAEGVPVAAAVDRRAARKPLSRLMEW